LSENQLLLFAIMLVMLSFWAQIKNLRTHCCKPYKLVSSGCKDIVSSDLERYNEGLLKYVKIMIIFDLSNLSLVTLFDHGA